MGRQGQGRKSTQFGQKRKQRLLENYRRSYERREMPVELLSRCERKEMQDKADLSEREQVIFGLGKVLMYQLTDIPMADVPKLIADMQAIIDAYKTANMRP